MPASLIETRVFGEDIVCTPDMACALARLPSEMRKNGLDVSPSGESGQYSISARVRVYLAGASPNTAGSNETGLYASGRAIDVELSGPDAPCAGFEEAAAAAGLVATSAGSGWYLECRGSHDLVYRRVLERTKDETAARRALRLSAALAVGDTKVSGEAKAVVMAIKFALVRLGFEADATSDTLTPDELSALEKAVPPHASSFASHLPKLVYLERRLRRAFPEEFGTDGSAVCFTAGPAAIPFAAGTIHAYLAADRQPPSVVAGISCGAVSAAAMQRSYRDLARPGAAAAPLHERELRRWNWFRGYLGELLDRPFDVIYDAIPNKSDFFADMATTVDPATADYLMDDERGAARERDLLVRLGGWVGHLPVPVSLAANVVVAYVRWKEGYGRFRTIKFYHYLARLGLMLSSYLTRPAMYKEKGALPRPLFGWTFYLLNLVFYVSLLVVGVSLASFPGSVVLWWIADRRHRPLPEWVVTAPALVSLGGFLVGVLVAWLLSKHVTRHGTGRPRSVLGSVLDNIGLRRSLLNAFYLRKRLLRVFDPHAVSKESVTRVGDGPMPLVVVAAPLQTLLGKNGRPVTAHQMWARQDAPLVESLCASLALPGLSSPFKAGRKWNSPVGVAPPTDLDLVDGTVVRHNPLPALFTFLRADERDRDVLTRPRRPDGKPSAPRHAAQRVTSRLKEAPLHAIHVVFGTPTADLDGSCYPDETANIVDVSLLGMRLAKRRDSQMEVRQTNFLGKLDAIVREQDGRINAHGDVRRALLADEISPACEISYDNGFSPSPASMLKVVAEGCRRSLGRLYQDEIKAAGAHGSVECGTFLAAIAPRRELPHGARPGLSEVCAECTGVLAPVDKAREVAPVVKGSPEPVAPTRPHAPTITVVASGGVFRGAFHIGMIAALVEADVRPDIVVGASVGTLMGGALAAQFALKERGTGAHLDALHELVDVFVNVDERVALTKTLKNASRELGVRARRIEYAPRDFARMIRRGAISDPSFAVTGAPSALIDTISTMFLIPHRNTAEIAALFVSGSVAKAVKCFLTQVKTESLACLGIEHAILGRSLLEQVTERLLSGGVIDLGSQQPFGRTEVYATTTNLGTQGSEVLGSIGSRVAADYSFVMACLASSAFPAIFAPVRGSDIFPATGPRDTRYSDGGIFDNLPFLPAFSLLRDRQRLRGGRALDNLADRSRAPNLFIVGALNVNPETQDGGTGNFGSVSEVLARSATLNYNVKIRSFERYTQNVDARIRVLLDRTDPTRLEESRPQAAFVNEMVSAAVLPIFPTDDEHLNSTFAFARSVGLSKARVRTSIANGCFETFRALVETESTPELLRRSLAGLRQAGKIGVVVIRRPVGGFLGRRGHLGKISRAGDSETTCPYFRLATPTMKYPEPFTCPFAERDPDIMVACRKDETHIKLQRSAYPPEAMS